MRPGNRPDALNEFKRRVNLTEYAAAHGYQLDRRASSRNSATMRHLAGDKIVVAKDSDGHWVYFSVIDAADHGSVIDFAQRRRGGTLGDVRKELRRWTGGGHAGGPGHPSAGVRVRPGPRTHPPRLGGRPGTVRGDGAGRGAAELP